MIFRFGECAVDLERCEVQRGDQVVRLEPKIFDVLAYLIEHRDRVVTKQELLDSLWRGISVSDAVLPRCVAALRRALGDTREDQHVIATVHGRGYRFAAMLTDPGEQASAGRRPSPPTFGSAHSSSSVRFESEFVGRQSALGHLHAALDRAEHGVGGVALITGEPGIGKTRLAHEIATRARSAGFEVQDGYCFEGDGAPSYWPWIQILRGALSASPDDGALRAQLGNGAAELAELIPELHARFGPLPAPKGATGDQARFRLYDAVSRFLIARAVERPLLLVIDDLHWADASSLGLLRFLARAVASARVLMVASYRDVDVRRGHPLADLLGALAREAPCERIRLSGFEEQEVATFLSQLGSLIPEPTLVARLHQMTDGNPFFLREILRLSGGPGLPQFQGDALGTLALPQGIKDAVGRRLDQLSEPCNGVLRAAAVLGRNFHLGLLEPMIETLGIERNALLELLAEAMDGGLIVETGLGRYAFHHALTRQTLYDELRAPQRIALHRSAGTAIEQLVESGVGSREFAADLAHHFFEVAPGGDVDKAIAHAVAAAEFSHSTHAYDESVRHFERALEVLDLRVPVDEVRRAELLLALGQSLFVAGLRERALSTLRTAADRARAIARIDLMARAAVAIRGIGEMGTPPGEGVVELLHESLERLPEDAYALRASVLSRLNGAAAMTMSERYFLAQQAIDVAKRSGDPTALRDAYGAKWWATLGPDRIRERDELARDLRALAKRTNDPRSTLHALECEIGSTLLRGDFSATSSAIDDFERIARDLRQPVFIFTGMTYRASWLINRGRYADATDHVEAARRIGQGVVPFADAICTGQRYWAQSVRGLRADAAGDPAVLADLLSATFVQRPISRVFLAYLRLSVDGDVGVAIELLQDLDLRSADRDEHWLMALTSLAWLAVEMEQRTIARQAYDALLPYADLIGVHDLLRAAHCSVASSLGILACGLGELDVSVHYFEQAIEREGAANMLPALAGSRLGLAQSLLRRGAGDDARRAADLMLRGEEACRDLGLGQFSRPRVLLERLRVG